MKSLRDLNQFQRLMLLTLLSPFLFTTFGPTAQATFLAVSVSQGSSYSSSARMSGVSVCVGTAANPSLYGSALTGPAGETANFFDIPNDVTEVTITVSKLGYQGVRDTAPLRWRGSTAGNVEVFSLVSGSGGTRCSRVDFKVASFQINGGQARTTDRIVTINFSYDGGAPTHYQISDSPEFVGAPWKEITGTSLTYNFDATTHNLPSALSSITARTEPPTGNPKPFKAVTKPGAVYGDKILYFRLKNRFGVTNAKSDSIALAPQATKEYEVVGNDLVTLLNSAKNEWGYWFDATITFSDTDEDCPSGNDKVDLGLPGLRIATTTSGSKTVAYTFFGRRHLNPYWELIEMKFGPIDENLSLNLSASSLSVNRVSLFTSDPQRLVTFKKVGVGSLNSLCFNGFVHLTSIKLKGPVGMEARDAFR